MEQVKQDQLPYEFHDESAETFLELLIKKIKTEELFDPVEKLIYPEIKFIELKLMAIIKRTLNDNYNFASPLNKTKIKDTEAPAPAKEAEAEVPVPMEQEEKLPKVHTSNVRLEEEEVEAPAPASANVNWKKLALVLLSQFRKRNDEANSKENDNDLELKVDLCIQLLENHELYKQAKGHFPIFNGKFYKLSDSEVVAKKEVKLLWNFFLKHGKTQELRDMLSYMKSHTTATVSSDLLHKEIVLYRGPRYLDLFQDWCQIVVNEKKEYDMLFYIILYGIDEHCKYLQKGDDITLHSTFMPYHKKCIDISIGRQKNLLTGSWGTIFLAIAANNTSILRFLLSTQSLYKMPSIPTKSPNLNWVLNADIVNMLYKDEKFGKDLLKYVNLNTWKKKELNPELNQEFTKASQLTYENLLACPTLMDGLDPTELTKMIEEHHSNNN